jgi:predicted transcriptional regulator
MSSKSTEYKKVQKLRHKRQIDQDERKKKDPNYKPVIYRDVDENGIGKKTLKDCKQRRKHVSAIPKKRIHPKSKGMVCCIHFSA